MAEGLVNEQQPVVFVVDDDASVRGAIENLLRSVGIAVQTFGNRTGIPAV